MDSRELVNHPFRINVAYEFAFENGLKSSFSVDSDLLAKDQDTYTSDAPEWTALKNHQCQNCPLSPDQSAGCPAAISIADIVSFFSRESAPGETVNCTVKMPGKTVTANKKTQEALASLVGLRMASSKCPHLSPMRLMARFHEPFSNPFVTVFRSTSSYLLQQYLLARKGETPDWELGGLKSRYENLSIINRQIAKRLKDPGCGASIQVLSLFSVTMTLLLEEHLDILKELA